MSSTRPPESLPAPARLAAPPPPPGGDPVVEILVRRLLLPMAAVVASALLVGSSLHEGGPRGAAWTPPASASPFAPLGVEADLRSTRDLEAVALDPRRSLPAETRRTLALRHAPELRFNAWYPMRDASPAHRTEDFYPMDVERFLGAIGWDAPRGTTPPALPVVVRRSERDLPAQLASARSSRLPALEDGLLQGYPRGMPGDAPDAGPVYADVYPDPRDPATVYAELWTFYPSDVSDAVVAGAIDGMGGHRSDWEHVTLALDVSDGVTRSRIRRAVYYGHEAALEVEPGDLELVVGTHPVVYVSQGKHASYPEPGEWRDYFRAAPYVRFDDVFHGNGHRARTWENEVVDIARAARPRPPWLLWRERWGGEDERILGIPYATSSFGPWFHTESNDRLTRVTGSWRHEKATHPGLRLDRALGKPAPRVRPAMPIGWVW
jgi:hypothetical protein